MCSFFSHCYRFLRLLFVFYMFLFFFPSFDSTEHISGKPLFMGSSTLHQVDVILQVCLSPFRQSTSYHCFILNILQTIGTPSQSEVLELCAPYAQQAMPARSRGIRMPVADLMPLVWDSEAAYTLPHSSLLFFFSSCLLFSLSSFLLVLFSTFVVLYIWVSFLRLCRFQLKDWILCPGFFSSLPKSDLVLNRFSHTRLLQTFTMKGMTLRSCAFCLQFVLVQFCGNNALSSSQ